MSELGASSRGAVDTVTKLVDAGERLIGDRGLDAVSIRAIAREAGANSAAMHYHFRSKDELLRAIQKRGISRAQGLWGPAVEALLARKRCAPREVAEAWARPLTIAIRDPADGMASWVRFVAAMLNAGGVETMRAVSHELFEPWLESFAELTERALPAVEPRIRTVRLRLMMDASFRFIAMPGEIYGSGALPADDYVGVLLDVLAGMLEGPQRSA